MINLQYNNFMIFQYNFFPLFKTLTIDEFISFFSEKKKSKKKKILNQVELASYIEKLFHIHHEMNDLYQFLYISCPSFINENFCQFQKLLSLNNGEIIAV